MLDGVRLAATVYQPQPRRIGETFPVLLEYLPYRKDDTFYVVDHSFFSYQAQLGFITVKVDIRGTGSSEGEIPEREYSDTEMTDCEEIIRQLATAPHANGNVGMFGVSWSGFNAIQMAVRRPSALKAICAVHASDDLYNDDLHYIDGNLHLDPYHLYICHELGLPRTPDYKLDDEYFKQRLSHRPWLFTYLNNQADGPFWQKKSLRQDPAQIDIPVYLVGGLLDGYRSATMRMYNELQVPVRCEIGPWDHSCPDEGSPGPNYEWQLRLAEWFNRYLRDCGAEATARAGVNKNNAADKELIVFVRHGNKPDSNIEKYDGYWRKIAARNGKTGSRPESKAIVQGTRNTRFFFAGEALKRRAAADGNRTLVCQPFSGTAAGTWWGNTTGDQSGDDAQSLVFDSAPLKSRTQIVGSPAVKFVASSTAKLVRWSVRLEDVAPDGSVSLITGKLIKVCQNQTAGPQMLETDLHFTTWTFRQGHKIRLAISNAQFPMAWPAAELTTSTIQTGAMSSLTLPVVPIDEDAITDLPKPARKQLSPDSWSIDFGDGKPEREVYNRVDSRTGIYSHVIKAKCAYVIDKAIRRTYFAETTNIWSTDPLAPASSKYTGIAKTTIVSQGKRLSLRTFIRVKSDERNFYVSVVRTITQHGGHQKSVKKTRRFQETIARQHQ